MPPMIKGFAIIIKKDHWINTTVYNQKDNQEKAGKTHGNFFPYRRGEEVFPGHIEDVEFFGTTKLRQEYSKKYFIVKYYANDAIL